MNVINLAGKTIKTDKNLGWIDGDMVYFDDGAWCNVVTGSIHNPSGGFISIEDSTSSFSSDKSGNEVVTVGPKTFTATSVKCYNLDTSEISVEPYDGKEITVTITGPKNVVDEIKLDHINDSLLIKGRKVSNVAWSGNSFSNFIVNGVRTTPVKVLVNVPYKTSVSLDGAYLRATIGDTAGSLSVRFTGQGDTIIGSVADATLYLKGQGDFIATKVEGTLIADLSGQGSISVKFVKLTSLSAINSGSGDITIQNGTVDRLEIDHSGSGKITVQDGTVGYLEVNHSGMGKITCNVLAETAKIVQSGMGNISVTKVTQKPILRKSGMGDITIGNW